jgi:hypothetical protein
MTIRVLVVTLNDAGELDVDQTGNAHVFDPDNEAPYDIHFQLTGTRLSSAEFYGLNGPVPGFQWITQPPDGVFPSAKLQTKRLIKLLDFHPDGAYSKGCWIYQLQVKRGSDLYSTTFTEGASCSVADVDEKQTGGTLYMKVTSDPNIINR